MPGQLPLPDRRPRTSWAAATSRHLRTLPRDARQQPEKAVRLLEQNASWWGEPIASTPPATVQATLDSLPTRNGPPAAVSTKEVVRSLLHAVDPSLRLRVPARPRSAPHLLTPEQLDSLTQDTYATRWQLGFRLGLTPAETLALRAEDVEPWPVSEATALHIPGPRARILPLPIAEPLTAELARLAKTADPASRIFAWSDTTDHARFTAAIGKGTPRSALADTAIARFLQLGSPEEAAAITGLEAVSIRMRFGPLSAAATITAALRSEPTRPPHSHHHDHDHDHDHHHDPHHTGGGFGLAAIAPEEKDTP